MNTEEIVGWFIEGDVSLREAVAFWIDEPGVGALRREAIARAGDGEVLVRTRYTGISRGTEASVFLGRVPLGEHERMRAPFQEGDFPGPVKYGYLNVGVVEHGPDALRGRTVFTLFPHQSAFVVTVVGAGMIGCCVARLARGIPGLDVVLVDLDPSRRAIADRLGVGFAEPDDAPRDRDLVVNTSGSEAGLRLALESVVTDGEVIEASWYGDRPVTLPLGADFHSRRLTIRSSQVGAVSRRRRGTRSTRDRLALALELLRDDAFDALLTGDSPWNELPAVMAALADGQGGELCRTIDWTDAS